MERTELHVFDGGSLTSTWYITDTLEQYVLVLVPYVSDTFILMQDNASSTLQGVLQTISSQLGFER